MSHGASSPLWPPLPLDEWQDTLATLHRWVQLTGKTRLAFAPPERLQGWRVEAAALAQYPLPRPDAFGADHEDLIVQVVNGFAMTITLLAVVLIVSQGAV